MSVTSAASMATSVPDAHRDAHVGLGQRRGVVDAVADHRHAAAPPSLEPADLSAPCPRAGPRRSTRSIAGLRGRWPRPSARCRRVSMTTSSPSARSAATTAARLRLEDVGDRDQPERAAVEGHEDGRLALARQRLGPRLEGAERRRRARPSARALPSRTRPSGAIASTPWPGMATNVPTGGSARPRSLAAAHDRLAERMLGALLDGRRQREQIVLRRPPPPTATHASRDARAADR